MDLSVGGEEDDNGGIAMVKMARSEAVVDLGEDGGEVRRQRWWDDRQR